MNKMRLGKILCGALAIQGVYTEPLNRVEVDSKGNTVNSEQEAFKADQPSRVEVDSKGNTFNFEQEAFKADRSSSKKDDDEYFTFLARVLHVEKDVLTRHVNEFKEKSMVRSLINPIKKLNKFQNHPIFSGFSTSSGIDTLIDIFLTELSSKVNFDNPKEPEYVKQARSLGFHTLGYELPNSYALRILKSKFNENQETKEVVVDVLKHFFLN